MKKKALHTGLSIIAMMLMSCGAMANEAPRAPAAVCAPVNGALPGGCTTTYTLDDFLDLEVFRGMKVRDFGEYAEIALRIAKRGAKRNVILQVIIAEIEAEKVRRDAKADKAERDRRHLELSTLMEKLARVAAEEAAAIGRHLEDLKGDNLVLQADNAALKAALDEANAALSVANASLKRIELILADLGKPAPSRPEERRQPAPIANSAPPAGKMGLGAAQARPAPVPSAPPRFVSDYCEIISVGDSFAKVCR